jgi:MFS family permease
MKNKNLSLLMLSNFVSLTGTQMQEFALSLYVLKRTGSATLFSSVLIVALIPQIIVSPIAGVFADWIDRKKIIIYLDVISSLLESVSKIKSLHDHAINFINIYFQKILQPLSI